jgi:hypothetical protein
MPAKEITQEDWAVVKKFRDNGYAIVIFNKDELLGAPREDVEDRLVELGWDVIDTLRGPEEPDEDS